MKALLCKGLVVASVLLAGCAGVPANLTGNVVTDRSQVDLTQGRQISATASGFQLLYFIPISINSRHETAYKDLVAQAGDGVLADISVTEAWSYGFVGTVYKTTMEATVYPRKAAKSK